MIEVEFTGTGALGDSIIIASKLFNSIPTLPHGSKITYYHYEHECKSNYKDSLISFWTLIKNYLDKDYNFNFNIAFYKPGQIKNVIHDSFHKGRTILTAVTDGLCFKNFPDIIPPIENGLVIVMDGANGDREISSSGLDLAVKMGGWDITLIGKIAKNINIDGITDLTGLTSFSEAMSYVVGSKCTIAPDGVLGYLAFLKGVPNVIYFHEAHLRTGYWCPGLRKDSTALVGGISTTIDKRLFINIKQTYFK